MTEAGRRAAGLVALALVLAVGCAFAGAWQYSRHVVREAAVDIVRTTYSATPVQLHELVRSVDATLPPDQEWRPVHVRGQYDPAATALLRNRPVASTAGFHVLVPLEITDGPLTGTFLVVDRGWVGLGDDASSSAPLAAPPAGEVDIIVRVLPSEQPRTNAAIPGHVFAIDPAAVAEATGQIEADTMIASVYGALAEEDPQPTVALGPLDPPSTDLGSHLSYAFQWWVFALGGLVAFGWLAVKELRDEAAQAHAADRGARDVHGLDPRPLTANAPHRRRRRVSAEDEEDALLDAAEDSTTR